MLCVALCFCVLLCVALCFCVLLCVALCCCALLCLAVRCCALLCVAVRCCALLCVALCCCVAAAAGDTGGQQQPVDEHLQPEKTSETQIKMKQVQLLHSFSWINTTLHNATLDNTTWHYITQNNTTQHNTTQHNTTAGLQDQREQGSFTERFNNQSESKVMIRSHWTDVVFLRQSHRVTESQSHRVTESQFGSSPRTQKWNQQPLSRPCSNCSSAPNSDSRCF